MDPAEILRRSREIFLQEATDLLQELDDALLALEASPDSPERIHGVFRPLHTLKGSSATGGMTDLAAFLHRVEDLYISAREGRVQVTAGIIDLSLRVSDAVRQYLAADQAHGHAILEDHRAVVDALSEAASQDHRASASPLSSPVSAGRTPSGPRVLQVTFRPGREVFYSGTDLGMFLDGLRALGPAEVRADLTSIPRLADLNPEECHLAWVAQVLTDAGEAAVREVFEFVADQAEILVQPWEFERAWILPNEACFEAEAAAEFGVEANEQLAGIESILLRIEKCGPAETVDDLFRHLHNLKGAAHLLASQASFPLPASHALPPLARLAHGLEDAVEAERGRQSGLNGDMLQTLFDGLDVLKGLMSCFERAQPAPDLPASIVAFLHHRADPNPEPSTAPTARDRAYLEVVAQCRLALAPLVDAMVADGPIQDHILSMAARSLQTLQRALGHRHAELPAESVSELARILEDAARDPSALDRDTVRKPLEEGIRWLHALTLPLAGPVAEHAREPAAPPSPSLDASTREISRPGPRPTSEQGRPAAQPATGAPAESRSLRVDQDKIDRLMRCVGELLVARGTFPMLAERLSRDHRLDAMAKEVKDAGAQISRLAEDLQGAVMAIRMLPIRTILQKFPRLVRDLARTLGKPIEFVTHGEETELDKTVLERLSDPLLHLVRNAVDHGIESPSERVALGKPPGGLIQVTAILEASHVVVRIADDGRGLRPDLLRQRAIEKGLLTPAEASKLDDAQARQLIMLAGFSTAEKVTDISGRGVGMDVVQHNLRQLHGTIQIDSTPGRGTTFAIRLPTSLMVSRGILLGAGNEEYIMPIQHLHELVKLPPSAIHGPPGRRFLQVRGRIHPVIALSEALHRTAVPEAAHARPPADANGFVADRHGLVTVAVVQAGQCSLALAVDRLVSEVDVIVKPLSGGLERIELFQGAAILGDGRIVLVLNPNRMSAGSWETERFQPSATVPLPAAA